MGFLNKIKFTAERLNKKAVKAGEDGDYKMALALVEEALQEKPYNKVFMANKCYFLAKLQQYEEALQCYEVACGLDKGNPELLAMKASVLVRIGRYEEAESLFNLALEKKPNNERINSQFAIALYTMGKIIESKIVLEHLLNGRTSKYAEPWFYRGKIAFEEGDLIEAQEFLEMAVEIDNRLTEAKTLLEDIRREQMSRTGRI